MVFICFVAGEDVENLGVPSDVLPFHFFTKSLEDDGETGVELTYCVELLRERHVDGGEEEEDVSRLVIELYPTC